MLAVFFLVLCTLGTTACSYKESEDSGVIGKGKRIFEETISPNKDYVENEKDVVYHTVEIYQNSDNVIIVTSKSTSAFSNHCNMKWNLTQVSQNQILM